MSCEKDHSPPDTPNSWIDLGRSEPSTPPHLADPGLLRQISGTAMERLLADAQREPGTASRGSLYSPPLSPTHVNTDQLSLLADRVVMRGDSDWMWDWSSRPEKTPPSGLAFRLRHPSSSAASSANSAPPDKAPGSWFTSLPVAFLTHAASFLIGAATVFLLMRRRCATCLVARSLD